MLTPGARWSHLQLFNASYQSLSLNASCKENNEFPMNCCELRPSQKKCPTHASQVEAGTSQVTHPEKWIAGWCYNPNQSCGAGSR
jgi:hypothetical protein